MAIDTLRLFALHASRPLGERISQHLQHPLSPHEEREFDDGEHKARPLVSVRNQHSVVIQSLYGDHAASVNDKLCRLLFFAGALKDAAARRVTAVVPYLCYARKDRRTQSRDPVTTRYVASLCESVGIDSIVTLDVHNLAAYQNAFRCLAVHLESTALFANYFKNILQAERIPRREAVVVSPDAGGLHRAVRLQHALSTALSQPVATALVEKQRIGGKVQSEGLVGDVEGRVALVLDDIVSTGSTLQSAVQLCHRHGAAAIYAAATHGIFVGKAAAFIEQPELLKLTITNTIPPFRLPTSLVDEKIEVLDASVLFARAIAALVGDGGEDGHAA